MPRIFKVPPQSDPREQRLVENVLGILELLIATVLATVATSLPVSENPAITVLGTHMPTLALLLGCVWLAQHGRARAAAWALTTLIFVLVTVVVFIFGGLMANNAVAYIAAMMIAGTTLGWRVAMGVAVAAAAASGAAVILEYRGLLPESLSPVSAINAWIAITITLLMSAFLHRMSIRSLDRSLELSEQARRALERSQAESETRARHGGALARLAERALASSDAGDFCQLAADTVREVLGVARVLVIELDDDGGTALAVGAGFALPADSPPALPGPLVASLAGSASGLSVGDPALAPVLSAAGCGDQPAGLALAIRGRDRVRGLFALLAGAGWAPTEADRSFVDTVTLLIGGFIERARASERAERSQKLEVVGRLANGVAHDVNNLLVVMMGVGRELGLLHDDAATRHALGDLDHACQHGALLTRQLLAFSRRQEVHPETIDLASVARELLPILRRLIGDDVRVEAGLSSGPLYVHADRGNLEQVILNLVVNAREAMPEGGTITVSAAQRGEDEATLTVRDTGVGMDEATRQRIFQPFFTTKSTGTGLGLATVSDIVRRHGGRVDVTSVPRQGSEFVVTLPRVAAPSKRERPTPTSAAPARPALQVLLAEDHDLVRAMAERILRRAGHTVTSVTNGREALALIESGRAFDVLVSDVAMPDVGGIKLLATLDAGGLRVPTVLVSGHHDGLPTLSPAMAGRVRFVPKPFTAETLLEAIEACLRGAAALTAGPATPAQS